MIKQSILMKHYYFVFLLLFLLPYCKGQSIENVRAATLNNNEKKLIELTYNLLSPHSNIPCLVRVLYSTKARQIYLTSVTGDVGNLVYPGVNKKILWDYQDELVHSMGEGEARFKFEVSPNIIVKKLKRGEKLTVYMDSIVTSGKLYPLKLYRHEKEVATLAETELSKSSFSIPLPKKVKARKDYQLGVVNGDKIYYSNIFKIKPKVGRFWKVFPFIAVPAFLWVQNYLDEHTELPGAPNPN